MQGKNKSIRQEGNALIHTRLLNAPRELVWEVWTDPKHIKEWWGPDGFTLTNKSMEVKAGKGWDFIMHGMGKDFDNRIEYLEVVKPSLLSFKHGAYENDPMGATVFVTFEEEAEGKTLLTMRSVFRSAEVIAELNRQVNAIEGGKQTLDKLEVYINIQHNIRKQLKTTNVARVCTYLNFSNNTEEAFNFYRSVFGGEFGGEGIKRFDDAPLPEGAPALSEEDKKLIIHVELTILGGHVLMGTDAPASMGFNLNFGNNMHISLEPDSREETKRLFDALAPAATITMDLQDMFWGAYFGTLTDKFGVQWMFNYVGK